MKKKEEKYIYCWNCGTQNKKKEKKCIQCGSELNEKEHPLFTWLFGEIKKEAGDGLFDYICNLASAFFKKHLYGMVLGLAVTFSVVSSVLNITEPEQAEITTEEYSIPHVVEEMPKEEPKEEVEVSKEEPEESPKPETSKPETPSPAPKPSVPTETPKPSTPTPTPAETPSTPQPEEKPKELYCPEGYTLTEDKKCKLVEYYEAWHRYDCPSGFEYWSSGNNCVSTEKKPIELEYYCASTAEEYNRLYSDKCPEETVTVKGTLDTSNHTCSYNFYDINGELVPGYLIIAARAGQRRYCLPGYVNNGDYCYETTEATLTYYCLKDDLGDEVLVNGHQCMHTYLGEPLER